MYERLEAGCFLGRYGQRCEAWFAERFTIIILLAIVASSFHDKVRTRNGEKQFLRKTAQIFTCPDLIFILYNKVSQIPQVVHECPMLLKATTSEQAAWRKSPACQPG
eukprot:EG_transcript_24318